MKYLRVLLLFFVVFPFPIHAQSLANILGAPAKTVTQSTNTFESRAAKALNFWASQTTVNWTSWDNPKDPNGSAKVTLPNQAIAKLEQGVDIKEVNAALLMGDVYSGVGTHISLPFSLAKKGDYDFTLLWLTNLIHSEWDNPAQTEETKNHIAKKLLTEEGSNHISKKFWLLIPETENHILMTETSRYLKNDLITKYGVEYASSGYSPEVYDNSKNGFDEWMLDHLDTFLKNDFDEYNSKPYEGYTTIALQNLYEHALNEEVREKARAILDYQALKFALTSLDLRRVVPFRRQAARSSDDNVYARDPAFARYALLAGNYLDEDSEKTLSTHFWPVPAIGTYRIPEPILDLMIEKNNHSYLTQIAHDNIEIVSSNGSYLISAGGIYHKRYPIPFTNKENGNVRPTVLMTSGGSPLISEMIRFEGRKDTKKNNNTCVYAGFACGVNLIIPESYMNLPNNWFTEDGWGFMDLGDTYIATYTIYDDSSFGVSNGGFLEVVNSNDVESYDTFREIVRKNNVDKEFSLYDLNEYTLFSGETVTFEILPEKRKILSFLALPKENLKEWKIKSVHNGGKNLDIETRFKEWPLINAYNTETKNPFVSVDTDGSISINLVPKYEKYILK